MRDTKNFHCGLLLGMTRKKTEKHIEIFLEFLIFLNKQKRENYLHGKAPNKQKKNKEISLGFLFNATANYSRKKNQKEK